MKYTAKGINASNMLVKLKQSINADTVTLQQSKNKENIRRLCPSERLCG